MSAETAGSMLEVTGLRRHFGQRGHWWSRSPEIRAVDGVSFSIGRGQAFGLVGESGSGKSTVARCVLGLERPDAGRIVLDGQDLTDLDHRRARAARSSLQAVFQNPASSLNPRWTIAESVAEPLYAHGIERRQTEARTREVLALVGLTSGMSRRHPHELSGGQQQRVAMARAIALQPKLIVADEPLSALDVSIQAQILNLMLELREGEGLSYLFISHDLAVTRHLCEVVAVFHQGRIVETGPSETVLRSPSHPYTAALVSASTERTMPRGAGRGTDTACSEPATARDECAYRRMEEES